ncbi:MAG: cobalamin biosynthesis protein CobW [Ruminococcaceae bacterium]|nr:cobalamin biosynthesis protein CobW [Oscillospiraceae bacterium]
MTKIDIYSGFLGAGKTTLIKKMIAEGYKGQKLVLIENEFGEIGIDGGFLQDAGINITEMNSGCICCSLVGDFGKALEKVISEYHPDRVIIEPSGVGKLSDVIGAVKKVVGHDVELGYAVAVADANKVKVYMKNFGEFYNNQIETASTIILSRTTNITEKKLDAALELIRQHNADATIVTTPWEDLSGEQLIEAMEGEHTLAKHMAETEHEHHHHHHDHDEHCCCGHDHEHHHHDHDEHCCGHHHHDEGCHEHHHDHVPAECGHEHHHHDHDEHCCCGHDHEHEHHHEHGEECGCGHHHDHEHEHHHHHEHGEECTCGCHDHDHHHHHADEVFTSWGRETAKKYTAEQISTILEELDSGEYGIVLRAKGIVAGADGKWIHFDHVPGEADVRTGSADVMGRLCVIGSKLDEAAVAKLFGL